MGIGGGCCGLIKESPAEILITNILNNLKLTEWDFNTFYKNLTDNDFPDIKDCEKIVKFVSIEKLKKVLNDQFSNPNCEYENIQKTLSENILKKFQKKGEEMVPLIKVIYRLMPFLSDSNHEKVFFFFAISNTLFKYDDKGELIEVAPLRLLVLKYLKCNLLKITKDLLTIITEILKIESMREEIKQQRTTYSEENVYEFFDAKFKFAKKFVDLETLVRSLKANNAIFNYLEIRQTFLFYFLKKEKDNLMSSLTK